MKTKQVLLMALLALGTLNSEFSTARAQGTAFTYQGQLSSNGVPLNGNYDFEFSLYPNAAGTGSPLGTGTATQTDIGVTNGLFIVTLDYGAGVFTGSNYWLSIGVRPNGGGSFTALNPLQELTPTPYAVFAGSASNLSGALPSSSLSGTYGSAVTLNNTSNSFTGNGTGLTNVNAATVGGLSASQFWNLTGNAGTTPGVNFVGTKDNEPLQLWANNSRAFLLDGTVNSAQPNVIGGSSQNSITSASGATIAGGYQNIIQSYANYSAIGGGSNNTIQSFDPNTTIACTIAGGQFNTISNGGPDQAFNSTIGGGFSNTIQSANYATIAGGNLNSIQNNSPGAFIGGGYDNTIQMSSFESVIAGGWGNSIQSFGGSPSLYCVIGGGYNNVIQTNNYSIIGGGYYNTIQTSASYATVAGGSNNTIETGAICSTIAGGQQNTIESAEFPTAANCVIGGGFANTVEFANYSTIAGGNLNSIQNNSPGAFIGGGYDNTIQMFSSESVITGGWGNSIQSFGGSPSFYCAIGGGYNNVIQSNNYSIIGGGYNNIIQISSSYSVIGGGSNNSIEPGAVSSFIGGGEQNSIQSAMSFATSLNSTIGGGFSNTIQSANYATIAGGNLNSIQNNSPGAFIGGGYDNTIQMSSFESVIAGGWGNSIQSFGGSPSLYCVIGGGYNNVIQTNNYSIIGGGYYNTIQTSASYATVAGGSNNTIETGAICSTIAGGQQNTIESAEFPTAANCAIGGGFANTVEFANYSTIGGGYGNTIQTNANYAVIPGGLGNVASGSYSFAAGQGAQATNQGAFVWSDSSSFMNFGSTSNFQFSVRANGGVRLVTSGAGLTLDGNSVVTNDESGLTLTGSFGGNGGSLTGLNASQLTSGTVPNSVLPGFQSSSNYSVIGGGLSNTVSGSTYSVIAGGTNNVLTNVVGSAIVGGLDNTNNGNQSTIGGGAGNVIQVGAYYALLGSGGGNVIATNSDTAFLGAGYHNLIGTNAPATVLGGGQYNVISNNATFSVLGGGYQNTNTGPYSMIPGGINNLAASYSFAAGSNALAVHSNAFVWSDGSASTTSTNTNSVTFRAAGGYRLFTSSGAAGAFLGANQTSWSAISDRNAKKNFQPVDTKAVLDKLAAIPIQQWNYKWENDGDVPNIGPMAQDFKAAFYPGRDDKSISTLEFDGVELAAIQGLNQKVDQQSSELKEKDAEIEKLKAKANKVDLLEKQLNELKQMVQLLAERK